jgi:hypothetical protein
MGGRHKNFEDWMALELLNYENKKFPVSFFLGHPVENGIRDTCSYHLHEGILPL